MASAVEVEVVVVVVMAVVGSIGVVRQPGRSSQVWPGDPVGPSAPPAVYYPRQLPNSTTSASVLALSNSIVISYLLPHTSQPYILKPFVYQIIWFL